MWLEDDGKFGDEHNMWQVVAIVDVWKQRRTSNLVKGFVCEQWVETIKGIVEPDNEISFFDQVKPVNSFCCLGDRLNASDGSEAPVTARTRIGWIKCRECDELFYGRKFSLKMKGWIYRSCVRSAIMYGSETWCLRKNEIAILRRTEKAMIRAMCGVKLIEKRRIQKLVSLLGLKDTLDKVARASRVRWYGHVLRRDDYDVLRRALDFEVVGRTGRGQPNMT